ncbi:ABC transporter permease [Enterococcus sp. HY326]|uniref:ABC transporter permease n=1 Tax=Enterococcus sp. HY326 TaxID=2971265 RepID=UPI00223FF90A|nr:ABC transporter permease [Enterococcus sp. HY326]
MNFLKRALASSWSKKGHTILLCAVFSAILVFVLAGLTIQSAANQAITNAQNDTGATVTLAASREAQFGGGAPSEDATDSSDSETAGQIDPGGFTATPVNVSDAEAIAELDNVASYSLESSSTAMAGDDVSAITSSDSSSTESSTETDTAEAGEMGGGMGGGMMAGGQGGGMSGDFQVSGVSETALASDFSDGIAEIIDGEGITAADADTNNVVIETTLAEANGLAVGDTFTLQNSDEDTSYTVTVKGIYETSATASGISAQISMLNPVNTIYSYYTFANALNGDADSATVDEAVYTLADPAGMDAFVSEAEALIDTDSYALTTNDQLYQQMLEPLNNVASFAKNIVILVAVAGIIILTLIVMLTIRERRYEIGVLLSMGESRFKMILQFFSEIFIAMVVALVIATFSGNIVGNVVGNQLLSQQSETTTEQVSNNQNGPGGEMGGGGPSGAFGDISSAISGSEAISELNVTVEPTTIAALAGLGLAISFLSIMLSSIGILRLNPKKILIS